MIDGSIVIRDNWNLADNSFKVLLNGVVLGEAAIGGAKRQTIAFAGQMIKPV